MSSKNIEKTFKWHFLHFFQLSGICWSYMLQNLKHGGFIISIIQADTVSRVRISSVTVVKVPPPFNM